MTTRTWATFAADAPELATMARTKLEASRHHVLATLAADGSPRVHAVEVQFHGDDLTVGMMSPSVKASQLAHDGRFALHANPGEEMGLGDAKFVGVALEVTADDALAAYIAEVQPPPPFRMFRLELADVVITSLHPDGDRLVIKRWRAGAGVSTFER